MIFIDFQDPAEFGLEKKLKTLNGYKYDPLDSHEPLEPSWVVPGTHSFGCLSPEDIGAQIGNLRQRLGIRRRELASMLKFSNQMLVKIESGKLDIDEESYQRIKQFFQAASDQNT